MLRVVVALALLCGCRSRAPDPTPVTTSSVPATPPSPIDQLFRSYQNHLPEPETLSESNGASLKCPRHGWVTYTLLHATAQKVPLASDADLVGLVPWTRADDTCLRMIAIEAIVQRIEFDSNRVSLPGMHEPDHYHHRDILASLRSYLVARQLAFDKKLFEGLMLDAVPKDFAALRGTWVEDPTPGKNFLTTVEIDEGELRVLRRRVTPSPSWPDHTWTTKLGSVTIDDRSLFVVRGEWDLESNTKGYKGSKIVPSQFTYAFAPVRNDVLWFDSGGASWVRLRRVVNP